MKALIIEDDSESVGSVSLALRMLWPDAELATTHLGKKGIKLAESEAHNIIILDLGLPDMSGFEVLQQIRLFSSVPIIILTVQAEEADIVKVLESGADDYIVKPCGQLELLARVKARMRDKNQFAEELPLTLGSLSFNPLTRQLSYGKKETDLTGIEARIIRYLMARGGRVATYSSIAQDVWGKDYVGTLHCLRVHIRRLRKKLEADPNHPQLILTKPRIGYFLANPG